MPSYLIIFYKTYKNIKLLTLNYASREGEPVREVVSCFMCVIFPLSAEQHPPGPLVLFLNIYISYHINILITFIPLACTYPLSLLPGFKSADFFGWFQRGLSPKVQGAFIAPVSLATLQAVAGLY